MTSMDSLIPKRQSLLDGVEVIACAQLGVTGLRHKAAFRKLTGVEGVGLTARIFGTIAENYVRGGASANKDRSKENWRWCSLQPQISAANTSPEVVLERAIAAACHRAGRTDWANQVPVASGLIAGAADGRRAIDLVHRRGDRHFELIELKIASDTPLYAAVEVIGYACLWLLARADPPARASELLTAETLDLRVLAPAAYYRSFELKWLEALLDTEMKALGQGHGVSLSFGFDVLPVELCSAPLPDDSALMNALAARPALFDHDAA